jgi:hypothetical protein
LSGQLLENVAILYGAALPGIKDTANIFIAYRSVWLDITHPGSLRGNSFKYFFVDSGLNASYVHHYLLSTLALDHNCHLLRSAISLQTTMLPNIRYFQLRLSDIMPPGTRNQKNESRRDRNRKTNKRHRVSKSTAPCPSTNHRSPHFFSHDAPSHNLPFLLYSYLGIWTAAFALEAASIKATLLNRLNRTTPSKLVYIALVQIAAADLLPRQNERSVLVLVKRSFLA